LFLALDFRKEVFSEDPPQSGGLPFAESPYPLYLPISFKFFSATSVTFALKIFSRNTSNAME